jgi:hypothetical protein
MEQLIEDISEHCQQADSHEIKELEGEGGGGVTEAVERAAFADVVLPDGPLLPARVRRVLHDVLENLLGHLKLTHLRFVNLGPML